MRIIIKSFANLLSPTADNFQQALKYPAIAQKKTQQDILNHLIKSEYGKYLAIKSLDDWHKIPIVEYDDVENWILQQQENKKSLLTTEPILFYEKTSGSRGKAKLIPYTKSLRRSFNQMFCVWAHDLIVHGPAFSTGKIYFCISPQLSNSEPNVNGLQYDSQYLDIWLRFVLSPFIVSPGELNRICTSQDFKDKLSQALILAENLEIISIWSPTFLKVILDYIKTNQTQLSTKLRNHISSQRYQLLQETDIPWNLLWSNLKLISCWDSANAADGADFLRVLFPNVLVQGKGLLATEAPMTIPLIPAKGCVPILDEVFFEFEDENGNIHHLHQLEIRKVYEIIISQKGGLYRYRIGDRVCVTHFYLNTPCLEFLGRTGEISDLVGEKLNSEFVRDVINKLPLQQTYFKSLVPVKRPIEHYILLLDYLNLPDEELAQQLDIGLQESPQYRHARLLGQLAAPQILVSPRIPEIISSYRTKSGTKWGDLKYDILSITPIDQELLAELKIS